MFKFRVVNYFFIITLMLFSSGCGGGGSSEKNSLPTAIAGQDKRVVSLSEVMLSGSGQDIDGIIVTYQWRQISGSSVILSNGNSAEASFIAPGINSDEALVFELSVIDNDGATQTDDITITVYQSFVIVNPTVNTNSGSFTTMQWQFNTSVNISSVSLSQIDSESEIEIVLLEQNLSYFYAPITSSDQIERLFKLRVTNDIGDVIEQEIRVIINPVVEIFNEASIILSLDNSSTGQSMSNNAEVLTLDATLLNYFSNVSDNIFILSYQDSLQTNKRIFLSVINNILETEEQWDFLETTGTYSYEFNDFNNDGITDVAYIVPGNSSNNASLYFKMGTMTAELPVQLIDNNITNELWGTPFQLYNVNEDLNDDGFKDIGIRHKSSEAGVKITETKYYLYNPNQGTFVYSELYSGISYRDSSDSLNEIKFIDLTGNNLLDKVTLEHFPNQPLPSKITVALATQEASYYDVLTIEADDLNVNFQLSDVLLDINQDGIVDIYIEEKNSWYVYQDSDFILNNLLISLESLENWDRSINNILSEDNAFIYATHQLENWMALFQYNSIVNSVVIGEVQPLPENFLTTDITYFDSDNDGDKDILMVSESTIELVINRYVE